MSSTHILQFFNTVREPEEITRKIKDDPEYGAPRGFGIRMDVARRILAARDQLPDRKFTSISQIEQIRGVGPDTCHDIAFTFAQILLTPDTPPYVKSLQQYYGVPRQDSRGTAVFFQKISPALSLEEFARLSFLSRECVKTKKRLSCSDFMIDSQSVIARIWHEY